MTDPRTPPSRPHPVSAGPSEAERQPPGRPATLQGRLLLQVNPSRVGYVREDLDLGRSGLILCGKKAVNKALDLRAGEFTGVLLTDPAVYEVQVATADDPFPHADESTFAFDDPLAVSLAEQRAAKVTAPLTPTGYIRAEDSDALKAVVSRVVALDDPSVVLCVPVDVAWLRDEEPARQLIAYLKGVKNPKALMLGGQMDPLGRYAKAVGNLRRVIQEVPSTALLRADLAAFGALADGAAFTSFGTTSRLRHIVPPGEKAKTTPGFAQSPHVLFPELMDFFLGATLAKRFAFAEAPLCGCSACAGRRTLDSFSHNGDGLPAAAAAHNVAVLMEWLRTLHAVKPGAERRQWWQERCRLAEEHYPLVNAATGRAGRFKVPEQLKRWAGTGPALSPTAPSAAAESPSGPHLTR